MKKEKIEKIIEEEKEEMPMKKEEMETPNLYLAAYLVNKHVKMINVIPLERRRVVFVFEVSEKSKIYSNRFYEGRSKVEPRTYSSICKDLKAQADHVIKRHLQKIESDQIEKEIDQLKELEDHD
jgi:hypothetical protein